MNEGAVQAKLREARVARLATADARGNPHVVPVCFAYDGRLFYTALDLKPKRVHAERLTRVHHIRRRPSVALVIDDYQEEWERLWYILVRGKASLLPHSENEEHRRARKLLKDKYPQYTPSLLPDNALLIRIIPDEILSWVGGKAGRRPGSTRGGEPL